MTQKKPNAVESAVDGAGGFGLVRGAVELAHAHTAEAELGDGEGGRGAQGDVIDAHDGQSTTSSALEVKR